ncbi:sensor histidine kinase [Undibacterium danionis]|uniref:Sensor histidine kinase n=1 Tax=Undibacterium danionis TaxID=1812100 RepID=A0ABV6IAM6_9BURK
MWRQFVDWHRNWQDEILAILLNPEVAQGSLNKRIARSVERLSSIERKQLHQFCETYNGWRLWRALFACATFFCGVGLSFTYWKTSVDKPTAMIVANVVGFGLLVALTSIWFNYRRVVEKKYRIFFFTQLSVFGGAFIGSAIGALMKNKPVLPLLVERMPIILTAAGIISVIYGILVGLVAAWRNIGYERIATQLQWEAEREKAARELSESQLRLLRAQIEPHFLFNTLGAVQQLAEQGSKDEQGQSKAAVLTANLIVFLRASMSEMRAEQVSLKDEFAMVEAYLEVMQVRMAHRLTFSLDLPPSYADYKIPSMVLLTLAENAIKHGLEPAIRGGSIHISAQAVVGNSTSSDLCITVQDTGVGLSDKPSHGIGLQNIRDRLRLAYSGKAGLEISEAEAGGVIAEISIPLSEGVLT